ncbi:type II secretion system F family protein [Hydrogenimonas cancrithermarum]|uniref:Pilin secretion/fimbrial assembly system protein, PilC n=1 Tax=Hydrogenimonas cancrithermarum TaxID=2993563 RepID=A0ABN6WUZ1_9BACT|nr:type II secretion system F family protein [Hydrogenimonas cancrithermarum]BDY12768.1 pilin secretion/fimbrial assembly system protein, PilC [Hydrogenimonas cancrithermarum]
MIYFFVHAKTESGKTVFSVFEVENFETLLEELALEELIPQKIAVLPPALGKLLVGKTGKVSTDNVIELLENVHLVVKSGLPLYRGIMDLAQDASDKRYKTMLKHIAKKINSGHSLESSMEPYRRSIGDVVLNLVRIGERTGQLEMTLRRAAEFLKKTTSLKRKAKQALIYPSFAFIAVFSAMLVWMIYVLPQMTQLFEEMDIELPGITLAVMAASDFLQEYILYLIAGIAAVTVLVIAAYRKSSQFRFYLDRAVMKIPIVSQIVKGFNIAFISEYLRIGIESGIPIVDNLDSLRKNISNEVFKRALDSTLESIQQGHQLSGSLKKTGIMTPFVIRMLTMGEESGSLDKQLETVSDYYYERVEYYAENIGKIIEPVILIVVGGFMALVMISIMGPLYDMLSSIK